ncbi:glucokinase [Dyadobacter koreensis]|uniref:Glucokinase n=2 Tax=Dyadobacter koreensis TaxID=408657 RepID=A0A1H6S4U1_9BACT|nr:glucokinase [Dyadobacter koreensis]
MMQSYYSNKKIPREIEMSEKVVMAIDLGGTQIKMGLVRGSEIICSTQIDSQAGNGLRKRFPQIEKSMGELLNRASLSVSEISGLGLAIPGIIDSVDKKILTINDKYNDGPEIDFHAWSSKTWGLPVFLENDTRAALLGEWKFGKGHGYDDIVLMNLGTGIGTSAVIEGKILRGKHFQAGILGGHFIVDIKGNQCNCGTVGCAEAEASTWNLEQIVKKYSGHSEGFLSVSDKPDFKTIFQHAALNNPLALLVRNHCLEVWAACALNLVRAYDPEVLILGGGIMASREVIIPFIQQKLNNDAWAVWGKVMVTEASLINTAALLGVASLVNNY